MRPPAAKPKKPIAQIIIRTTAMVYSKFPMILKFIWFKNYFLNIFSPELLLPVGFSIYFIPDNFIIHQVFFVGIIKRFTCFFNLIICLHFSSQIPFKYLFSSGKGFIAGSVKGTYRSDIILWISCLVLPSLV